MSIEERVKILEGRVDKLEKDKEREIRLIKPGICSFCGGRCNTSSLIQEEGFFVYVCQNPKCLQFDKKVKVSLDFLIKLSPLEGNYS